MRAVRRRPRAPAGTSSGEPTGARRCRRRSGRTSADPVEVEQAGERAGLVRGRRPPRAPARGPGWSAARRSGRAAGRDDVDARRQAVLAREQLTDPVVADDDEAGLDQLEGQPAVGVGSDVDARTPAPRPGTAHRAGSAGEPAAHPLDVVARRQRRVAHGEVHGVVRRLGARDAHRGAQAADQSMPSSVRPARARAAARGRRPRGRAPGCWSGLGPKNRSPISLAGSRSAMLRRVATSSAASAACSSTGTRSASSTQREPAVEVLLGELGDQVGGAAVGRRHVAVRRRREARRGRSALRLTNGSRKSFVLRICSHSRVERPVVLVERVGVGQQVGARHRVEVDPALREGAERHDRSAAPSPAGRARW